MLGKPPKSELYVVAVCFLSLLRCLQMHLLRMQYRHQCLVTPSAFILKAGLWGLLSQCFETELRSGTFLTHSMQMMSPSNRELFLSLSTSTQNLGADMKSCYLVRPYSLSPQRSDKSSSEVFKKCGDVVLSALG